MNKKYFYTALLVNTLLLTLFFSCSLPKEQSLLVLASNDVHSQVDEFPANHKRNAGKGGYVRKMAYIDSMRTYHSNVLLLDAGDVSQGTPYFNMFGTSLQIELMNIMGYDAMTLGNHEFDNGLDSLAQAISKAKFPIVCSNYDFTQTPLEGKTTPYYIVKKSGVKIGLIGLGPDLNGLASASKIGNIKYLDPVVQVNKYAELLKKKNCDLVIVISHLGYDDKNSVSDLFLAKKTRNIDLILGGHTHTNMNEPHYENNLDNKKVAITQSYYGGIKMTEIMYKFLKY